LKAGGALILRRTPAERQLIWGALRKGPKNAFIFGFQAKSEPDWRFIFSGSDSYALRCKPLAEIVR
jgi:hypothetical protein